MSWKPTRRTFLAGAAAASAVALSYSPGLAKSVDGPADLVVAEGSDAASNARTAVEEFGGIGSLVKSGDVVGVSINAMGSIGAAHTDLDVLRALVEMCREAGAREVRVLSWLEHDRMSYNRLFERVPETGAVFQEVDQGNPELWQEIEVPRGRYLKKIRMMKALWEPDVFVMLPVCKHHGSANYTGCLKLALATTVREDNRKYVHQERSAYLEECIADLNTVVRPPDLVIMDAMKVLATNGPRGPGKIVDVGKIIVGKDKVAIDAYCMPFIGRDPGTSRQIQAAAAHGLGERDLSKLAVREIKTG